MNFLKIASALFLGAVMTMPTFTPSASADICYEQPWDFWYGEGDPNSPAEDYYIWISYYDPEVTLVNNLAKLTGVSASAMIVAGKTNTPSGYYALHKVKVYELMETYEEVEPGVWQYVYDWELIKVENNWSVAPDPYDTWVLPDCWSKTYIQNNGPLTVRFTVDVSYVIDTTFTGSIPWTSNPDRLVNSDLYSIYWDAPSQDVKISIITP